MGAAIAPPLRVEADEFERLDEREVACFACGELSVEDPAALKRSLEPCFSDALALSRPLPVGPDGDEVGQSATT